MAVPALRLSSSHHSRTAQNYSLLKCAPQPKILSCIVTLKACVMANISQHLIICSVWLNYRPPRVLKHDNKLVTCRSDVISVGLRNNLH